MQPGKNPPNTRNLTVVLSVVLAAGLMQARALNAGGTFPTAAHNTRNVVLVMMDGMRWKEIFRGADPKLINKRGPRLLGDRDQRTSEAKERFWRDDPTARRQALMPFFWSVVAKNSQVS